MKTIASGTVGRAVAAYGENAPAATACCNACRACVTTNLLGIALAVLASLSGAFARLARRSAGC
jgi:hypothetical protein